MVGRSVCRACALPEGRNLSPRDLTSNPLLNAGKVSGDITRALCPCPYLLLNFIFHFKSKTCRPRRSCINQTIVFYVWQNYIVRSNRIFTNTLYYEYTFKYENWINYAFLKILLINIILTKPCIILFYVKVSKGYHKISIQQIM